MVQAAFLLSRILSQQGDVDDSQRELDRAACKYNEIRPENQRTVDSLTVEDVGQLLYYDYF